MAHQYKNYPVAVMVAIDQFGNALTGGNPDSTISARVGYFSVNAKKGRRYWKSLEAIIDFAFYPVDGPSHSYQAWQSDSDEHFRRGNNVMLILLSIVIFVACPLIAIVLWLLSPLFRFQVTAQPTEDMSDEERFALRRMRVKRRYTYINVASGLCLVFIPFWIFVRLFFCWSDSCSGVICWLCEFHWVISLLLIVFMVGFVLMSLELIKLSRDQPPESLPEKIDNPWIPGVKTAVKSMHALSATTRTISIKLGRVPGAEKVSGEAGESSVRTKTMPGVKTLHKAHRTVQRMEHGRALLEGNGPQIWTFIFTLVALLTTLFLMFGPFKYIFWS